MKKTLTFQDFRDAFEGSSYKNNFTYEGKRALFDYLENYEEETGEQVELDTVALCCEYTEYANLKELQDNYTDTKSMEELEANTIVIPVESGSIIIANF
jgi:hypothetical protein